MTEVKVFCSGGTNISYTKTYTKEDKDKKCVIFVHGNSENGGIYSEIAERLSTEYTVFCPDSRSHGKSDKVGRLHYADIADDIANLITHENMEKPVFFGFSDGGIAGLILAAKHPDILKALFAAGINLSPAGIKPSVRRLMRFCFFFSRSDKLRLMLSEPDITASELQKIKTPTTVFYAEKDIVVFRDSQIAADNINGCELVVVPGENHGSYILDNGKLYGILAARLSNFRL